MSKIEKNHHQTFESIREQDAEGAEFWSARALQRILEYAQWRKFEGVIEKAKIACENSGKPASDHFAHLGKMVALGSGARREIADYRLSRYACYLIVQNGDPKKPMIAAGQTYFAMQTRRQELADDADFRRLDEDQKRIFLRNELKTHNKQLSEAANQAGVASPQDFAIFQNHGYRGLYGGLGAKQIHQRKGLKKSQQIADHMGSTELAANLFRATQAEEKLRRENIKGKQQANTAHHQVGVKVRETIREIGGTMPEELPTPETSVKALEKGRVKKIKGEGEK
ncbi:MAG: DNA damage-inducible protein D [bacterium]